MVWGIKDEYFEKVYGESYKPKIGTSQGGIRQEKTMQSTKTDADKTCGNPIRDSAEKPDELQGELPIEEISLMDDDGRFGGNGFGCSG